MTGKIDIKQEFCVHVGTYDGQIMGFKGTLKHLESKYAYAISPGSIKTILTEGRYLFVAGYDEIIRIYDTKKFKEVGNLDGHLGSILTMTNHKNILLSSGDDGNIMTWKFKEWSMIHKLKAHTTTIYDICLHPSGKILISISKDNRMFVWNMVNGQKAYQKRFPYNLNKVIMHETDKYICLLSDYNVHIINSSDNKEISSLNSDIRISDFITYKKFIIVGDEQGNINIWDPKLDVIQEQSEKNGEDIENEEDEEKEQKSQIKTEKQGKDTEENSENKAQKIFFKAHSNRVKKMRIKVIDGVDFLITVSSSGELKIWDFLEGILKQIDSIDSLVEIDLEKMVQPVYQIYTNQRITSMDVTVYEEEVQQQNQKQKKGSTDVKDDEEQEEEQEQAKEQEEKQQDPNQPKSILKKSKKIVKQQQQPQQQQKKQKQLQQNQNNQQQKQQQQQQQQKQNPKQQQQNNNKNNNKKNKNKNNKQKQNK